MTFHRLLATLFVSVHCAWLAQAAEVNGLAALGASETAGNANDYTGSWVPYFVNQRGLNFGGPGNPYNVAVGGAESGTLLAQGQHTEVAGYVQDGLVDVAYLSIGGNDFLHNTAKIASGAISGPALDAFAQNLVSNIETAMDTIAAANPLGMIVTSVPDVTLTASGRLAYNTPAKLANGQGAVDLVNSLLKPEVLSRGFVYVDYAAAMRVLDDQPLLVGGVLIDVTTASDDPTHFFQDGVHPAAVGNGLVANLLLEALNLGYGTNYPLLTDLEILTTAGLGSSYIGETSNLPYASFITLPVPEPSSLVLAMLAGFVCLIFAVRRHR